MWKRAFTSARPGSVGNPSVTTFSSGLIPACRSVSRCICLGLIASLAAASALAAPGELDPTFGDAGRVRLTIFDGNGQPIDPEIHALAQQADGKLLLGGSIYDYSDGVNFSQDLWIGRLNADGSLDTSFDGDGWTRVDFQGGQTDDSAYALTVQPDGRIVAVGYTSDRNSGAMDMALVRFNTDGSLDTNFGTGGLVAFDGGGTGVDRATGVARQNDGSLVIAGNTDRNGEQDVLFARFTAGGQLDATFGTDGVTIVSLGSGSYEFVNTMAQDANGALVAVGQGYGSSVFTMLAIRVTADGDLDTSFDADGIVLVDFSQSNAEARSVAIRSDGKIVLGGYADLSGSRRTAIALLDTNGSLDTSLGGGGTITHDLNPDSNWDETYGVVVEPSNSIVVAGGFQPANGAVAHDMFMARFDANGSGDTTFGNSGLSIADFGVSQNVSSAQAVLLLRQSDGRLVAAGTYGNGQVILARFDSDGGGFGGVLSFKQTYSNWEENAGTVTIPVRRTGGATGAVSVNVRVGWTGGPFIGTLSGAGEGCDYTLGTTTLNWADGDYTDKDISVTLIDDAYNEFSDYFQLELYNASGATTAVDTHQVNISYDSNDTVQADIGSVSIEPTKSVGEGDGQVTLVVSRTGGSQDCAVVGFYTSDSSSPVATAGIDYTARSGLVQFGDGDSTNKQISIPITDDLNGERDEYFAVWLTANAIPLGNDYALVTILDNDGGFAGTIEIYGDGTDLESDGAQGGPITFSRWGGSNGQVTVGYAITSGTATAGTDFVATSGTIVWSSGDTTDKEVFVEILEDTLQEADETYIVTMSNPTGGAELGSSTSATQRIIDNDTLYPGSTWLTADNVIVRESSGQFVIRVLRQDGRDGQVTVDYATSDGTATAGADYQATSGTLTWADGEGCNYSLNPPCLGNPQKIFTIPIIDDPDVEESETLAITLSNPTGGLTLGSPASVDLSILKSDPPGGVLAFTLATINTFVSETAGTATLKVTRTGGLQGVVTVDFRTVQGTATPGLDYTSTSGTLTWADGDSSTKDIVIPILDDALGPPNDGASEYFFVYLENVTGDAMLDVIPGYIYYGYVDIRDDESSPGTLVFYPLDVNEGAGTATLNVYRSNGNLGAVSVNYTTVAGTAIAPDDFTTTAGTLNWVNGDTSVKQINVPITDDAISEATESFTIVFSNPTGSLSVPNTTATVTITDNDNPGVISMSLSAVSTTEANTTLNITATRTVASVGVVSVSYSTANGTATAGEDYTATSGTLNWASGESGTKTIPVGILDDTVEEIDESFAVTLSNPTGGATLGAATTTVTIEDNDANPGTLRFTVATRTVSEAAATVQIDVERFGGALGAVTVGYATADDTAVAGSDYTSTSGTVSWVDGERGTRSFSVPIVNDTIEEADETFTVTLSNPTGGALLGTPSTQTVTIQNDDAPNGQLGFALSSTSVTEGGDVILEVTRILGTNGAVGVSYETQDLSATAPGDYTSASGTLSWANGDTTSRSITIVTVDDATDEPAEQFDVVLFSATGGASIGTGLARVTLDDNDTGPPGTLRMLVTATSVTELSSSMSLTVTRSDGASGPASVGFATQDDTAEAGQDYVATSGTLTWGDFDSSGKSITIQLTDDTLDEPDETFFVLLSAATGAALDPAADATTVTILDNDLPPVPGTIAVTGPASVGEADGSVTFTFSRTGGTDGEVGVSYATAAGTAASGSDFTAVSGTLTWADGDAVSKTVDVPIINDSNDEPNETFSMDISNPTGGATLGNASRTTIIVDDDVSGPGTLSIVSSITVFETVGNAILSVTRSNGFDGAVSVNYASAPGTAQDGPDFTGVSGTLNWTDGDGTTQFISVPVVNDQLEEPVESFTVILSGAGGGATIGVGTATVNIQDDDIPGTLAFTQTATVVDETAGSINVSVSRSNGNRGPVSVDYATASGSATDGSDFTGTSGTLSWVDGDSANKSFTIAILNDTAVEFEEDFTVALSNPTGGASLGGALLTVTIVSDEVPVPGTVRMVSTALSVSEAAGTVDVEVERVVGSDGAVSIDYTTQAGTATAADFTPTSGTLNWADGDAANKIITVTITNDAAFEPDEVFAVNLSNPGGGAILAEASTTITIQNDDVPVPGVIGMASATRTVSETAGTVVLSVTRTGGADGAVGVSYATAPGTATAADFTPTSGTLNWADGDSAAKTVTVPILDDAIFEVDEDFTVTLSSVTGGASLGVGSTTVTIINDDPAQQGRIEMASATASIGETAGTVVITVNRVSGSDGAVGVSYATAPGTATAADFTAGSGTLSWADGDAAAKTITVPILDDADFELDETFAVTLSNVTGGAVLGTDTTTVTIVSDDAGIPGTLGLTQAAVSVDETAGLATLTVERTGGSDGAVGVNFATAPGTATASDFTATSGTLSWAHADSAAKTITVPITDDAIFEADETFTVALSGITGGASLGTSSATVTIVSEDPPQRGTIAMASTTLTVDETAGTATLLVTRTGGADGTVGVSYATAAGTATAADFTGVSGTLSWVDGDSAAKTIIVPITNDTLFEPDEIFTVALSNVTGGATLGTDTTVVTIASDDPPLPGTLAMASATATVNEADGSVLLSVTRTGGADGAVGVSYATAGGTATAADFTATSGTLSWADGVSATRTITVPITNDALIEANESFAVTLSNPTGGASLGAASTTVTIVDDDIFTVPGTLAFTVSAVTVNETDGTVIFTVTRSNGLGGAVGVNYATASGTATSGADFVAASGVLNWPAGDGGPKTITVTLTDDTLVENDETFTVTLSGPSGGAGLGTATVTVTIQSEDIPPDTTPDPFSFTNVGGVTPWAEVQSNEITVAGINAPAPISIVEGEYSINGGPFTIVAGTVPNGARVRIRVIAAGTYDTTVQAVLTIGGVSGTFHVTTRPQTSDIVVKAKGGGGGFGAIGWVELLLLGAMALGLRLRAGAAVASLLLGCLLLVPTARAQESGVYLGAGVGQSEVGVGSAEARQRVESATGDVITSMSFDEQDTSFHLRVGYAVNRMLAIEAAYYGFGDTRSEVTAAVIDPEAFVEAMADAFPSNVHGPALLARLSWPVAERWAVHLRGGLISWKSEIDAEIISGGSGRFKATRKGEDLIWGTALSWRPSDRFVVSLEFTQAQLDDEVRTIEFGVTWLTGWRAP